MHEGKEKEKEREKKEREKKEKKKKKSKGDILSHFELIRYGWKKGEFSIQILGLFNPALSLSLQLPSKLLFNRRKF